MKKDFDFIKEILIIMNDSDDAFFNSQELLDSLSSHPTYSQENALDLKLYNHLQLLYDGKCIKIIRANDTGTIHESISPFLKENNIGFIPSTNKTVITTPEFFRLTNDGYNLLGSLNNNEILETVKKKAIDVSIDSIVNGGKAAMSTLVTTILSNSSF